MVSRVKFGAVFLSIVAVVVVLYLLGARLIDPRGDFGTGVFPSVVYDARAQKLALFDAFLALGSVDGVVLGSSRAMKIRPADLEARTRLRFFNFAVDRALPDDMLAVYSWIRQRGARPRVVFIGLDAEAFLADDRLHWKLEQNAPLRQAHAAALGATSSPFELLGARVAAYKRTLTLPYVGDAALAVRLWLQPHKNLLNATFDADGYFRYPRWEAERANGTFQFERTLTACQADHANDFLRRAELSRHHKTRVDQLVAHARRDGVQVKMWLTGFHPDTVRYLEARTTYAATVASARAFLSGVHGRHGVETYDLSEIDRYDGTRTGWYDCGHIDEENARLIAAVLTGPRG